MQDELRDLEKQLKKMDDIDSSDPDEDIADRVRSRKSDFAQGEIEGEKDGSKRHTLLNTIRNKLVTYRTTVSHTGQ